MTRIELKGRGFPTPVTALPDPNISDDVPPRTLLLSSDFDKTDYVSLGYTHFEVVCIGAVGGNGGKYVGYGGGGGGGGLHRMAGLLSELPDVSKVDIGVPGANGIDRNSVPSYTTRVQWHNPSTDQDEDVEDTGERPLIRGGYTYINDVGGMSEDHVLYNGYIYEKNSALVEQTDGGDGGHSAFNDGMCSASGGKGGKAGYLHEDSFLWEIDGTTKHVYVHMPGNGGDGGVGGSIIAGGGADGSVSEVHWYKFGYWSYTGSSAPSGSDGTWDGVIGKGGGGGRGGLYSADTSGPDYLAHSQAGQPSSGSSRIELATNGGQGSFNYGDTSYFGPRQVRQAHPSNGKFILPGTGGGAKLGSLLTFGSRSPGANPAGAVWIRLTKIV